MVSQYPSFNQRALAAARSVTVSHGANQRTIGPDDVTSAMAAETYGVSRPSVERALLLLDCVSPEPLSKVEAGELCLLDAAAEAKKLGRTKRDRSRKQQETFTIIVF